MQWETGAKMAHWDLGAGTLHDGRQQLGAGTWPTGHREPEPRGRMQCTQSRGQNITRWYLESREAQQH